MSSLPDLEPDCTPGESPSIELTIAPRPRDLGGFSVRRLLPVAARRMVGPFIFYDYIGPAAMAVGEGIDVRPHPHISLATVTYLFEGEIVHRDSVGSLQAIRAGDVNWMLAGRGIVHSERTSPEERQRGPRLHGIQSWVALPLANEEDPPGFEHHPRASLPLIRRDGATLVVVAGTAYGERSPAPVLSPTLYVEAQLEPGARLEVDATHPERAVHLVEGSVRCDGQAIEPGVMVVLRPGTRVSLEAAGPARVMLVGGAPLDGTRHVFWNFVSSSKGRIARAADDWRAGRFPKVPGDEVEFIPLP